MQIKYRDNSSNLVGVLSRAVTDKKLIDIAISVCVWNMLGYIILDLCSYVWRLIFSICRRGYFHRMSLAWCAAAAARLALLVCPVCSEYAGRER